MKNIIRAGLIPAMFIVSITSCNQSHNSSAGNNAQEEMQLLSNEKNRASCVYMTRDEKNLPIISWVEENSASEKSFYFARWDEQTSRFYKATEIPIAQNAAVHEEGMPKIALRGNGSLIAIYEVTVPQPGQKWGVGDVVYIESDDHGKRWSDPKSVNTKKNEANSLSFSGIARLSDGEIAVAWLDANSSGAGEQGRPVMFARTHAGQGFGEPVLVDEMACECCRISVTGSQTGTIAVAFRDLLPGNIRDISISTSADGGKTFSKAVDFSSDGWQIDGCPHNGPSLSAGNNKIFATWYSGGNNQGVHFAELDNYGNRIRKRGLSRNARFTQLAVMPDGTPVIAYNESYHEGDSIYNRIVLNKLGEDVFSRNITSPGKHGAFPVIQADGDDHVLVAWRDGDKVYYSRCRTETIDEQVDVNRSTKEIIPNSIHRMDETHD